MGNSTVYSTVRHQCHNIAWETKPIHYDMADDNLLFRSLGIGIIVKFHFQKYSPFVSFIG